MRKKYFVFFTILLVITGCTEYKDDYSLGNNNGKNISQVASEENIASFDIYKEDSKINSDEVTKNEVSKDSSALDTMYYTRDADKIFNRFISNELPAEYMIEDGSTSYCYYSDLQQNGCYIVERRDIDNDGEYELLLAEQGWSLEFFLDARDEKVFFLAVTPADEHFNTGYAYYMDEFWIVTSDYTKEEYRNDFYSYGADGEVSNSFYLIDVSVNGVEKCYYNNQEINMRKFDEIRDSIRWQYYGFE